MGFRFRNIICVAIIFTYGCAGKGNEKEANHSDSLISPNRNLTDTVALDYDLLYKLESYLVDEKVDTSKLRVIDFDCAVLIYPTSEQIEKMKREEGEENFYIGADDSNWYQGLAIGKLDSIGVTQISTDRRYIKFVGNNHEWVLDIRKRDLPAWNLILFS